MGIFGGGNAVEPQYKKVSKSRIIKTGMSEQLRQVDKDFGVYDHMRTLGEASGPTTAKKAEEWGQKLKKAAESIKKVFEKKVDWTPAEQTFLKKLIQEINDQHVALAQTIKKAAEELKKPSVDGQTLKDQKEFLTTGLKEWKENFASNVKEFEQWNGYLVGNQTQQLTDTKVAIEDRQQHFNTYMPKIKENIDGALATAKRQYEVLHKKLEGLYKNAKILGNNTDVKKLDAQILIQEKKIIEEVKDLDKRVKEANTTIANLEKMLKEGAKKK